MTDETNGSIDGSNGHGSLEAIRKGMQPGMSWQAPENASTNTQQAGEESDSESNQGTSPPLACLNMGFWIQVRFFLPGLPDRKGGQSMSESMLMRRMGSVSRWVRMPQGRPDGSHAANEEHRPAMGPLTSSQPDARQAGQRDDQQVHGNGAFGIDQPGRPAAESPERLHHHLPDQG